MIQAQRGVNRNVTSMHSRPLPAEPSVKSSPDSSLDVRNPSSSSNEYTSAEFPPDRVDNPADDTTQNKKKVALEGRTADDLVYESIPAVLFETCAADQLHLISENAGLSESGDVIPSSRKKQSNIGRLNEMISCKLSALLHSSSSAQSSNLHEESLDEEKHEPSGTSLDLTVTAKECGLSATRPTSIEDTEAMPPSDLKHTYIDFSGNKFAGVVLELDDSAYMIPNTSNIGNEDDSGYLVPDVLKHTVETSSETSEILGDRNIRETGERRFVSCAHKGVDIANTDGKNAPASPELQHAYFTVGDTEPSDYSEQKLSSTAASRPRDAESEKCLYSTEIFSKMEAGVDDILLDESGCVVPCKVLDSTVMGVQRPRVAGESSLLTEGVSSHQCIEPLYTEPDEEQIHKSGPSKGEYAEIHGHIATDDLERNLDEFGYLSLEETS